MKLGWLVGVLAVVLAASFANAAITGWQCADDGDGAVTMGPIGWSYDAGADEYALDVVETQYWGPAHLEGTFTASGVNRVTVLKDVTNATSFVWTGYTFNVYMQDAFSVLSAFAPLNWTAAVTPVSSGTFLDDHGNTFTHMAVVTFSPNAPAYNIGIGQSGDFGVKFSFAGDSTFEIEQAPAPEPATLAMLALGGLFLRRARKA